MFVLMGANGNITSKAARQLLKDGHAVRVIGRSETSLAGLKQAGVELAIGDAADATFLTRAFLGAEAVFTMVPPNHAAPAFRSWQNEIGANIAHALKQSGVKRVINLSSIGGHLANGTGLIAGLHDLEAHVSAVPGLDLLHLRPGYFFENHLNAIGTVAGLGVMADLIDGTTPIGTIATQDIAQVVARELPRTRGIGARILHLRSPNLVSQDQAAAILGAAIGKPDLKHVKAPPEQVKAAMVAQGCSQNMADLFEEMSNAISGSEFNRAFADGPTEITPTTLEEWAPTFAALYAQTVGAQKAA